MYNDSVTDWFVQARDNVYNVSRQRWMDIASSIVFLILISRGRKTWLNFLTFMTLVGGVLNAIYPSYTASWVTGNLDSVHYELIRVLGLVTVAWCVAYFLVCKSTDETTQTSYQLSFTVVLLCHLLMFGNSLINPPKKSSVQLDHETQVSKFYGLMLWTVGTLFYTVTSKDWGGYGEQRSHANFHLRIWFVILLVGGCINYAMPGWAIRTAFSLDKVDSFHVLLIRSYASMLLGMALMVFRSANFLRGSDRDLLLATHLLFLVSCTICSWVSLFNKWSSLTWKLTGFQLVLHIVLFMNLFGAMDRDITVFKRVMWPRVKAIPQDIKSCFKFKQY
ncbi:hypothetical protein ACF0H5_024147 [Mactra antiquata]